MTFSNLEIKEVLQKQQEKIKNLNMLVSRSNNPKGTIIKIGNVEIGGTKIAVMAGPCCVENKVQFFSIAQEISKIGVRIIRGGAFKPRTSPYSFQGLGDNALTILSDFKKETGMLIITEAMEIAQLDKISKTADIIQIGARNMQNFNLLKAVGKIQKPILLKRGHSATVQEWLLAAEYVLSEGNSQVILCERGIRTFETATRNTLDLSVVPLLKSLTHLPVIVDPSHGTGRRLLVPAMAKAAIIAGADGLLIEVHNFPEQSLSDGEQSLDIPEFVELFTELKIIAPIMGRKL